MSSYHVFTKNDDEVDYVAFSLLDGHSYLTSEFLDAEMFESYEEAHAEACRSARELGMVFQIGKYEEVTKEVTEEGIVGNWWQEITDIHLKCDELESMLMDSGYEESDDEIRMIMYIQLRLRALRKSIEMPF